VDPEISMWVSGLWVLVSVLVLSLSYWFYLYATKMDVTQKLYILSDIQKLHIVAKTIYFVSIQNITTK